MMAIDAKFLDHIEKQFPGRDIPAHNDEDLHSTVPAPFATAAAPFSP